MRVLFLDIDGPMIPNRAYALAEQTEPYGTIFDNIAVAMINSICEASGAKIVLHTSWIRTKYKSRIIEMGHDVKEHCIGQGLEEKHFHENPYCDRDISYRYDRIADWLSNNEVDDFAILDNVPPLATFPHKNNFFLINADNGISLHDYRIILEKLCGISDE